MADRSTFLNSSIHGDWEARLAHTVETMREMSRQTDPEAMVRAYGARMRAALGNDRTVSLSRRNLAAPWYRITRSSTWTEVINPWKSTDRLPLLQGGLLGELLYGQGPRVVDEIRVEPGDPAAAYFEGMRSLIAVPHFDSGVAQNMVVHMKTAPAAYDREAFPEYVLLSGLFGRATQNLVLSTELRGLYEALDRELKVVSDIQRSLLPTHLPEVPGMDLAASYETSKRAGGDYYDLFPLPGKDGVNAWGILIADVSGHGTPAAVVMAILHSIVHSYPGPAAPPGRVMEYVNARMAAGYMSDSGGFVTAFYGVYDPGTRELTYSSAGHNPPRLRRADGSITGLEGARRLPLGIMPDERYSETTLMLTPGEKILFYTDGITEARGQGRGMFGVERLDAVVRGSEGDAAGLVREVLAAVELFAAGRAADDDRTLLAMALS